MREWNRVGNDKLELESKADCKTRTGRSPDLMDATCIVVEMARRKGFMISKLANESEKVNSLRWFWDLAEKQKALAQARELVSV